jgi:low temperature requirement protein LtrA
MAGHVFANNAYPTPDDAGTGVMTGRGPFGASDMSGRLKRLFWQPPRAHGDVIEDRSVSFLELFYDLVYVVVIARAAHTLAGDVSWRSVAEFAVVFALIWIAWLNGSLYYDLHGREDGRTRVFVFIQMMLLVLLAVFTGDAAGEGGTGFAIVYAAYLVVVTWLWYSVRRQDAEEYLGITARYLTGMAVLIAVVGVSAFLPDDLRMFVWAALVVGYITASIVLFSAADSEVVSGMRPTESLVERFGLFTIIVLGEVVVGVVDGLSDIDRTVESVSTGVLGLAIGFAFWWTYFDFIGQRMPKLVRRDMVGWMFLHLPVTMSIAATGAALVSLIEHAGDDRAPAPTAWLLTGAVTLGLVALVFLMRRLEDFDRLPELYQQVSTALVLAAAAVLLVGGLRPAPWLLAFAVVAILSAVWIFAVDRWLRLEDPEAARPGGGSDL